MSLGPRSVGWPASEVALGIAVGAKTGKYVSGIAINKGQIQISYGLQANATALAAAQNLLTLKPLVSANNDVIWLCGYHAAPAGAVEAASGASTSTATTVLPKYLPSNCRA